MKLSPFFEGNSSQSLLDTEFNKDISLKLRSFTNILNCVRDLFSTMYPPILIPLY